MWTREAASTSWAQRGESDEAKLSLSEAAKAWVGSGEATPGRTDADEAQLLPSSLLLTHPTLHSGEQRSSLPHLSNSPH